VPLLHATRPSQAAASRLSLLAGTETYLRLGTGRTYYPVTSVHLSNVTTAASLSASPVRLPQVGLSFRTSSLVLLGKVLRAGVHSDRIERVSLAIRKPGPGGRPVTELVETYRRIVVSSFTEHLSGQPAGSVSLVLSAASRVASTPAILDRAGPFAALPVSSRALATRTSVRIRQAAGNLAPACAVTSVQLTQAAAGAPLDLSLTTTSRVLLRVIHGYAEGAAARIPVLTLSVRSRSAGAQSAATLTDIFSGLSVSAFAENLHSGTATLVVSPQ